MTAEPRAYIPRFLLPDQREWVIRTTSTRAVTAMNVSTNSTSSADEDLPFVHFQNILLLLAVLVSLCGLAGNGAVVWLLGFRIKRTPFSVYALNLACADLAFLLSRTVLFTLFLCGLRTDVLYWLVDPLTLSSYLAGLGLLVAVSSERCASALWPLWFRCRRPARLSSAVCAGVWGLALCGAVTWLLCVHLVGSPRHRAHLIYYVAVLITSLALCVSGLTLLMRVRRSSWQAPPTRLYLTVLLKVMTFLLLALPYTAASTAFIVSPALPHQRALKSAFRILSVLNSAVNPVIYFFVGRRGQGKGRAPLRKVLQRALRDEQEGAEQRGTPVSTETTTST